MQRLLTWINSHDCGVTPTGVARADGAIDIRVEAFNGATGERFVETTTVRTLGEARDALGY
jgi:hypothetical protein